MASDKLDRGSERGSGGRRWEINKTVTYLPFSPRQAYTRHFSLLYLHSHPPPSLPASRTALCYLPSSLVAPFLRYLPVALFLLLFVSLRFRTPSHTGFEAAETKRLNISIWHQPLFSMSRSHTLIYISLSHHSAPIYPLRRTFLSASSGRPVARSPDAKGRTLPTLVGRKGESGDTKSGRRSQRVAESARGGPTSMERGRKSERKTEKSQEHQEETTGWRQRGWLNPGLFARSKWRSAVILKFSRWQGARIGLKNQSGSLFLMITASRPESGNCCCCCWCFLPISLLPATSALRHCLSVSSIHVYRGLLPFPVSFLASTSTIPLLSVALRFSQPPSYRARDSPNLSLAQPLPLVSSPPPTIAIAIVNRFKYDGCIYGEPAGI